MTFDIEITGHGFYSISAASKRGTNWMKQVDGFDGRTAYSDQTGMTQDIVDGAYRDGLTVAVNGRTYLGNNRVAA